MIKVAFFDVGETLIHDGRPIPGVVDALKAISQFKTEAGQPLLMAIVSNFTMPSAPVTEEKILTLEKEYRSIALEPAGLAGFFEPFDRKVTISSRAGVSKPAQAIFNAALARLHTTATLKECLFVTEEEGHLKKAKEYGMLPVGFGSGMQGIQTFSNWDDAPLLLANLVAPDNLENLALAVVPRLDSQYGISAFKPTKVLGHIVHGTAKQLMQLNDPRLGTFDGIYVERPTMVTVELSPTGGLGKVQAEQPDPEEVADAITFVQSLIKGDRIALDGETRGTTHAVQKDSSGRVRLVRKRYD